MGGSLLSCLYPLSYHRTGAGAALASHQLKTNSVRDIPIRRGSFRSVPDLVRSINRFVEQYNAKASPFVWTATAQSILAKVERLASYTSGTSH